MINPEIRFVTEKIVCGNYLKKFPHSECNIKDDGKRVNCPTRIGKLYGPFSPTQPTGGSILLCGKRQSYFPFQCFVGPDWPMLIAVYFLIFSVNLIVLPIISYLGWPVVLIGSVGFLLLLYCYSAVACSNPGIIFDEYEEELVPFNSTTTNNNNNNTSILNDSSINKLPSSAATTTSSSIVSAEISMQIMNPMNNSSSGSDNLDDIENQNSNRVSSGSSNSMNDYNCNHSDTDSSSNDSSTSLKRAINEYDEEKKDETTNNNSNTNTSLAINRNNGIIATSVLTTTSSSSSVSPTAVLLNGTVATTSTNSSSGSNYHTHVSRNKKDQDKPTIECGTCEIHRPFSARHCHHCGVCVQDLDHHCPWCSKCIGKNNMLFFKAFLAILCFQCYFLIGSLVYYFIAISKKAPLPIGPQFPGYS